MASKELIVFLNPGHGGFIKSGGGLVYTTDGKRYNHNGFEAFEGEINRVFVNEVIKKCNLINGVHLVNVCPTNLDLDIDTRCNFANDIAFQYKRKYNYLWIGNHSNAGKGEGVECFTTKKDTGADKYATLFLNLYKKHFPKINIRTDYSDGDPDKEANFRELKETKMPAILFEDLFFDNYSEAQMLYSDTYRLEYISFLREFLIQAKEI